MQLELAFLERPVDPDEGSKGPWEQIDPQAQIAALVLLSHRTLTVTCSKWGGKPHSAVGKPRFDGFRSAKTIP
jgi:hypothetical protein